VTRGMEAVAVSFTATADVAGSSDKLDPNLRAFTAAVPSLPYPALARTRSVSRSRRSLGRAETCGLLCRRSCVQSFVVRTSAVADVKPAAIPAG
jgi:hypothetical protein